MQSKRRKIRWALVLLGAVLGGRWLAQFFGYQANDADGPVLLSVAGLVLLVWVWLKFL